MICLIYRIMEIRPVASRANSHMNGIAITLLVAPFVVRVKCMGPFCYIMGQRMLKWTSYMFDKLLASCLEAFM